MEFVSPPSHQDKGVTEELGDVDINDLLEAVVIKLQLWPEIPVLSTEVTPFVEFIIMYNPDYNQL